MKKILDILKSLVITHGYSKWCMLGLKEIVFTEEGKEFLKVDSKDVFPQFYQNGCRIYLDEYPEQEEMRVSFTNGNSIIWDKTTFTGEFETNKGSLIIFESEEFPYNKFMNKRFMERQ